MAAWERAILLPLVGFRSFTERTYRSHSPSGHGTFWNWLQLRTQSSCP